MTFIISVLALYQLMFLLFMLIGTGPPYDFVPPERRIYLLFSLAIPTLLCFPIVAISTTILVIRLKQTAHWRHGAANQARNDGYKERRVARSVVCVCFMFIVCFFPNVLMTVATNAFGNFQLDDPYLKWLVNMTYACTFFFQTANSSLNIFVYYTISSRYRGVFKSLFLPTRDLRFK